MCPSLPVSGATVFSISPSGKRSAVFRTDAATKKKWVELWEGPRLVTSLPAPLHDRFHINRGPLGRPAWNKSEDAIVYVAESKPATRHSYWDGAATTETRGTKFMMAPSPQASPAVSWGEQLTNVKQPRVF